MRASCVLPRDDSEGKVDLPDELRNLARDVRRIGCAYRADPESIAAQKDGISKRLALIARRLEVAR